MINPNRQKVLKEGIEEGFYPRFLYHYSSCEKAKLLLKNNTIKYSSFYEFNDPFEGNFALIGNVTRQEKKKFFENFFPGKHEFSLDEIPNEDLKKLLEDIIIDSIKSVGIFCLSKNNDSLLMWAHYAEKHQGVCFKFDLLKDLKAFSSLHKVVYTTDYLNFNIVTDFTRVNDILIHKSVDWMYEEEYRVLKINEVGLGLFNPEALVEVDFGYRVSTDDKKEIKEIVDSNKGYNVQFKQATKHPHDFRILVREEKSFKA